MNMTPKIPKGWKQLRKGTRIKPTDMELLCGGSWWPVHNSENAISNGKFYIRRK